MVVVQVSCAAAAIGSSDFGTHSSGRLRAAGYEKLNDENIQALLIVQHPAEYVQVRVLRK
jgi:hypothetical protein